MPDSQAHHTCFSLGWPSAAHSVPVGARRCRLLVTTAEFPASITSLAQGGPKYAETRFGMSRPVCGMLIFINPLIARLTPLRAIGLDLHMKAVRRLFHSLRAQRSAWFRLDLLAHHCTGMVATDRRGYTGCLNSILKQNCYISYMARHCFFTPCRGAWC